MRERASILDVLPLLLPPVVLVLVYISPVGLRRSLVFDHTEPTIVTAFTSVFIHFDTAHLLLNLTVYLLAIPVLFALSVANGTRRRFHIVFLTFLLVFPLALSYLNLVVFQSVVGFGFSGVMMVFIGYLLFALADYLEGVFNIGPADQVAPVVFLLTLVCIVILSVQSAPTAGRPIASVAALLLLAIALSILLYVSELCNRQWRSRSHLGPVLRTPGHLELILVAVVLIFAVQFAAFPPDPALDGGVSNLYAHFLGYALGFLVVFTAVETAERLGWSTHSGTSVIATGLGRR